MTLALGSLFTGYGGLDMAASMVLPTTLAWVSEIDPAACRLITAHHPNVPNLGDVTTVDWSTVPRVDVLTGGYPCQPFSHAGQRQGTNDDRHLWPYVRDAIAALRPMVTILENVDGHRSLGMDVVLGDLAALGLDAEWTTLRAAEVGAPHGRARVFIIATDPHGPRPQGADPRIPVREERSGAGRHPAQGGDRPPADAQGDEQREPAERVGEWSQSADGSSAGPLRLAVDWGRYAPAIARWERVLQRPSPPPTIPGPNGRPRLSPTFVEFMMGLPAGHVTGHGLSSSAALKALGNGVVPLQAATAIRHLLDRSTR